MQSMPGGVKQAILAIWITIGLSAIGDLIAKLIGIASFGDLIGAIFFSALLCIIPYKLSNRSNAARYFYAVITVASLILLASGSVPLNKIDYFVSILFIPVEIFIIYRLFQAEANSWFTAAQE
ncbi:hypothetical protein KSF73_11960 [Burkholderiaceae bacterium DAT-1]|nr:hypothetical protein [Burkholderiaceae bacterium DAT-1]